MQSVREVDMEERAIFLLNRVLDCVEERPTRLSMWTSGP